MSLEIILMDNSPLIQKTLHYFLQPYTPHIHPFNQQNKFPQEIKTIKPDLVFIDSEHIQYQDQIDFFQQQNIPLVFLSKENETVSHSFQGELKKPIEPKNLQTLVGSLVPRTQNLKLNSFLEYESLKSNENSSSNKNVSDLENKEVPDKKDDKKEPSSQYFSTPIMIDEIVESTPSSKMESTPLSNKNSSSDKDLNLPSTENSNNEIKMNEIQKDIKDIIKKQIEIQNQIQNTTLSLPDKASQKTDKEEILTKTSVLKTPLTKKEEPIDKKEVQKIIESTVEAKIQKDVIQKQIQQDVEDVFIKNIKHTLEKEGLSVIRESIQELLPRFLEELIQTESFQNEIKETIHRMTVQDLLKSSQSLIQQEIHKSIETDTFKKLIQDIIWKIVPELSKQMIQKEIDKTNESDS